MTQAISYLRVSSVTQIDGDGLPRQREAIAKYAAAHDIEILQEFADEGVSGTTELENRPGLAACLERIENNGVKLILVESSDRLARDAMVSELIIREAQKHGGTIITASGVNLTEGGDLNPTAALIRGILALIAEFDRRVIVLKLRAARERKKKREGRCEGVAPFGLLPEEKLALATIRQMAFDGISAHDIGVTLNREGIKSRSGKPWRASVIRKILARERNDTKLPVNLG